MSRKHESAVSTAAHEGPKLVGGLLRRRRESLGLTLEEVGRTLRFAPHWVVAVEEGRVADLPPQPYARGLISAYATLVGLEPAELLRVCGQPFCVQGSGLRLGLFFAVNRAQSTWREWTVPAALTAAVISIVVARSVLAPEPLELIAPASAPVVMQRPVQMSAPSEVSSPAGPDAGTSMATPGVRVLLRCEGTTWVEATPAGAETRRYELGPGQNLEITARERLALSIGDAGVIRVMVNDRDLGFIGYKGETKTGLSFTAPGGSLAGAARLADGD